LIVDAEGQRVVMPPNAFSIAFEAIGGGSLSGTVERIYSTGGAVFSNLTLFAPEGVQVDIKGTATIIGADTQTQHLYVDMRNCSVGDYFNVEWRACVICAAGTIEFTLDVKECVQCSDWPGITCLGGASYQIEDGYWIAPGAAECTTVTCLASRVFQCPISAACTTGIDVPGRSSINNSVALIAASDGVLGWRNATGPESALNITQCSVGHESRLCGVCNEGYGRVSAEHECGECPSPGLNVVVLLVLGALFVLEIAFIVTKTLQKKVGEKSEADAAILKVVLNYLQVVSFAAVIDFSWPTFMRDTLKATSAVSTPRSLLLAGDCLLQRSTGTGAETFLARLGVALGFPPLLAAAAFVAIAAAALIPRRWILAVSRVSRGMIPATEAGPDGATIFSPMTRRAVVSIFVTLFTIYPTVMHETLLLFSCMELDDGESYLLESLDLRCYGSRHVAAVASLGMPGIVFYIVGVPVGIMALLWWRRDDLHADEPRRAQELMWFVYGDYAPRYFYWEGCLMLRKALVVAFTVTMVPYGGAFQLSREQLSGTKM
jgi:hypothetical protein